MRKLDLVTLIDLEAQLLRDADRPPEMLEDRDAAIAREIDAARLDGPPLFLAWWGVLRQREYGNQPTPGERVAAVRDVVGVALTIGGVLLGFASVWGYLAAVTASGRPVNVVHFVALFLGVQWLLLLLWLVLVLPVRVPGLRGLYLLLEAGEAVLPRVVHRAGDVAAHTQRIARLYGRLRLWWISRVTQGFALALNVGFVLGFVAASVFSDPSFGWRSTLIDGLQMTAASDVMARPWSWAFGGATVSESDVYLTRYSSLDAERFTMAKLPATERDTWRAWWWFLDAALLTYGVLPRAATWLVSGAAMRRQLRRARLDHAEFALLRDRLKRPGPAHTTRTDDTIVRHRLPALDQVVALRWSAVGEEAVATLNRQRDATRRVEVKAVGTLNVDEDDAAVQWAAGQRADVVLLVPGWEPPVGEFVDLARRLRDAMGESRQIVVAVCGDAGNPTQRQVTLWADAMHTLRDPRLRTVALTATGEDEP